MKTAQGEQRRLNGNGVHIESTATRHAAELETVLGRYRPLLAQGLREAVETAQGTERATPPVVDALGAQSLLETFYGQIEYHLGWRHPDLSQARHHPGKMLRPTLVLLACELAAGAAGADTASQRAAVESAVPAAVAVELVHNFSLVHDDIEDGDEERRHRPTLWKLWGVPEAINAGDGIFALARMSLWRLGEHGVAPQTIVRLAALLDRTCVELCEGQYLDMAFEGRGEVTGAMYLQMIGRKTAALMACATEMGAAIGAPHDVAFSARLAEFGQELGLGFQIRDDLLGIWAAEDLGKSAAGDLRHKKMSLPVIYALEHASPPDRQQILAIYAEPGAATGEQVATLLAILDRTGARTYGREALAAHCTRAREALDAAAGDKPAAAEAYAALSALLAFVAAEGI